MRRREVLLSGGSIGLYGLFRSSAVLAGQGFFVPPEEGRHKRTFMQWPVSPSVYGDPVFLEVTQQTIADIANAIVEFEPVTMLVSSEDQRTARAKLSGKVELWDIPTDDLWCRDSGPIFVVNDAGRLAIIHIQFNGWGGRQASKRDNQIAARVAERLGLELIPSGLYGEGGGVEHEGHGLLMAHESSWVNDNRNPGASRDDIEARLLKAYGAKRMIWSEGVWDQDITDYHIDSLARFTGQGRVLMNLPDRPDMDDPFHVGALDTHDTLVAEGLSVDVIPEPNSRRVRSIDFVASYANYYVCNGAVMVAEFGDPETDHLAQETLAHHFPGREIVALKVDPLGELGGGIHCATQQMPAV
ncbi:agmatine deiminase family protein [Ruegeria sp. SCP11]|uniref:agmatine deiminase family protein n=1 Tax=Ruegeria sp. SCP11 TaxID=3141378 RepID=UPI0033360796